MSATWSDTRGVDEKDDALLDEEGPVLPHRSISDDADLDITPMIDITFLLLIFFIVASTPDPQSAAELPPARYGVGVGKATSVVLTIVDGGLGTAPVYLADGKIATAELSGEAKQQADEIEEAIREAKHEGKENVIIKAERGVAHREVARVAAAASRVEGMKMHVAVLEVD